MARILVIDDQEAIRRVLRRGQRVEFRLADVLRILDRVGERQIILRHRRQIVRVGHAFVNVQFRHNAGGSQFPMRAASGAEK